MPTSASLLSSASFPSNCRMMQQGFRPHEATVRYVKGEDKHGNRIAPLRGREFTQTILEVSLHSDSLEHRHVYTHRSPFDCSCVEVETLSSSIPSSSVGTMVPAPEPSASESSSRASHRETTKGATQTDTTSPVPPAG